MSFLETDEPKLAPLSVIQELTMNQLNVALSISQDPQTLTQARKKYNQGIAKSDSFILRNRRVDYNNQLRTPWSRLVQQLLKPKRLLKLLQNHTNYDLSLNFGTINLEVLDQIPKDEIEETLNKVVCGLIGYHHKIVLSDPPQVSRVSVMDSNYASQTSTMIEMQSNTYRAEEILCLLKEQVLNCRVGEYEQVFK